MIVFHFGKVIGKKMKFQISHYIKIEWGFEIVFETKVFAGKNIFEKFQV